MCKLSPVLKVEGTALRWHPYRQKHLISTKCADERLYLVDMRVYHSDARETFDKDSWNNYIFQVLCSMGRSAYLGNLLFERTA